MQIDSLPTSVDDAYERILQKINARHKPNAQKVLLVIVGARRPLTIGEMALALGAARAQQSDSLPIQELNKARLQDQIRQWCGLFVFINHSKIFLIHQTAKEFLLADSSHISIRTGGWKRSFVMAQVENEMASLCIQYLHLSSFNRKSDGNGRQCENGASDELHKIQSPTQAEQNEFFEYCAEHWASHLNDQDVGGGDNLLTKILSLYDTRGDLFSSWFPIMWRALMSFKPTPNLSQHVVAFNGHAIVLDLLYKRRGFEVEARDSTGRTALMWAAGRGNEAVVKWLLDAGADVNAEGGRDGNALYAASEGGHQKVVKMLLDAGAKVNTQGGYCDNALRVASWNGDEKVVKMLLDAGADVNAEGGDTSALQAASWNGDEKMVKMLLDAGADVNAEGAGFGNALQAASEYGNEKVVKILLDAGASEPGYETLLYL